MTYNSAERRIRASFPVLRLFQAYMPLPLAHWLLKQAMVHARLDTDTRREAISADGVPCEWIIPQNSPGDGVLLYLHGGGFVYGLTPQHLKMVAYLASKMGTRSLMVDYRLAPDHPFPAALDDCVTGYRWLLKQGISAKNLVVAGDSAGGNLTIAAMMKLRDSGDPLPAAMACLSPVGDFSGKNELPAGFKDPLLPRKAVKFYNQSYVGHNDPQDPLISPVFGDWRALPPMLVHVGEDELLRDDAVRMADMAKSAGVQVRLEIYPRMWHVWQLFLSLPQAVQSLDDIAQFLKAHLKPVS
jgi:monoterpene epsilon-lactone hydrolase